MRQQYPVSVSCCVLEVSASGYFNWLRRPKDMAGRPGGRHSDEALLVHIRAIHAQVKGEYGWPRMHKELLARGIRVGKDRVRKLMQQHGIRARTKRKFVVTTDSRHSLPVAPDLVQRRFTPEEPNQLWSGDITYIATDEGWLYLAAVIDLFSRQVVGWSLQPHMQTSLVKDALAMAWWRRRPPPGLIFHSDRGSQGGFNWSSQHRVTRQILGSRSALLPESSNPAFCVACCSGSVPLLEPPAHSTETGRCPWGSIGAAARSCFRWSRAAMDYEDRQRRLSLRTRL
jgi:hypothetical protein